MIINYLKNIGYVFIIIFISTIFISILNYFSILRGIPLNILSIVTIIVSLFIGGFLTGKKANKKGYLEGIKFGTIMIVMIILLNLILFKNKFTIISILYYLLLLLSSTFGAMIGIMRKK